MGRCNGFNAAQLRAQAVEEIASGARLKTRPFSFGAALHPSDR